MFEDYDEFILWLSLACMGIALVVIAMLGFGGFLGA